MFTLLIVYMRPLCIYIQSLYILWFISSNEIHQQITNFSVNNCIYFNYSLCTLKPGEKLSACSKLKIYQNYFFKNTSSWLVTSLLLCCVVIVLHPSSCHVHANIDIECLYLSLYHCNALVYENTESWSCSPASMR